MLLDIFFKPSIIVSIENAIFFVYFYAYQFMSDQFMSKKLLMSLKSNYNLLKSAQLKYTWDDYIVVSSSFPYLIPPSCVPQCIIQGYFPREPSEAHHPAAYGASVYYPYFLGVKFDCLTVSPKMSITTS